MKTVGVRELKAHLSSVLRDVQRGESILVTDRGRVIAELRQPEQGRAYTPLARLAASGHVRIAEPTPDPYGDPYPKSPLTSPAGLANELLSADSDES